METLIQTSINLCQWDTAQLLIFSDNVFGTLIYYSHFFALILSLIVGIFVFTSNRESLTSQILLFMTVIFSLWVFFDLVLWATDNSSFTMFFWSLEILIEPMIYGASVYFLYVFINKNDIKTLTKILLILPILPIIILLPTKLTLLGFDLTNCDRNAVEGFLSTYYTYFIEILYVSWIFVLSIVKYIKAVPEQKRQIFFITLGIILFLLSFSFGNIIGSFTDDWVVGQLGLFGMPIFAGFLAYMIVRFKTFNIKLLGAQALVFALGFLVLAVAFIRNIENVKLVIAFTLLFVLLLGRALIKSVRKEVMQREQLQILSEQLFDANEKLKGLDKLKTEFLSLASHQLRSPLTAMKGYSSMLMEGDFGEINPKAKEAVERIFQSTMNLTKIVEDFLNVSKIEAGGMKYEMGTFSLSEIARDMSKDLSITAGQKGLKLNFESDSDTDCTVNGDREKVRQVVLNFIDNSIKYTKEGTVNVSVKKVSGKVIFSVKDTGMGMTPEIKATLFQKFARGDGARMNTGGSGLGLYLAKEIIEAHKGTVDVESDGPGKGSNFHFELDTIK